MAQGAYVGRNRAYTNVQAVVEDFVRETEQRMLAVMRSSIHDVVENSNTPVAKGGRMRVDTGFLRASGRAAIGGMPSGPDVKPPGAGPNSFAYEGDAVVAVLSDLKLGDTFSYGWTANYARYRELYDGFMEGALQQWPRIVAFNTDTLKQRIG